MRSLPDPIFTAERYHRAPRQSTQSATCRLTVIGNDNCRYFAPKIYIDAVILSLVLIVLLNFSELATPHDHPNRVTDEPDTAAGCQPHSSSESHHGSGIAFRPHNRFHNRYYLESQHSGRIQARVMPEYHA